MTDVSNSIDDKIFYNITNNKVYVSKSLVHGRGVFANEAFDKGDIIEIFPLVPTNFRTRYQGDGVILHYCFVNNACGCRECLQHGYVIYISSGYGNLYNHQPTGKENARFQMDYKNFIGQVIANKIIKKDEEIYVNYGPNFQFDEGMVTNHEDSPR